MYQLERLTNLAFVLSRYVAALTQTKPYGKEKKGTQLEQISEALNEFKYVYLFELENARNSLLKEVRAQWTNNSNSRYAWLRDSSRSIFIPVRDPSMVLGNIR